MFPRILTFKDVNTFNKWSNWSISDLSVMYVSQSVGLSFENKSVIFHNRKFFKVGLHKHDLCYVGENDIFTDTTVAAVLDFTRWPVAFTGYIGCYSAKAKGDWNFTSSHMTVTACREICYGGNRKGLYKYRYAAVKDTECHCFIDFPAYLSGKYNNQKSELYVWYLNVNLNS